MKKQATKLNRKKVKTLTLHKETLRSLADGILEEAAGARTGPTGCPAGTLLCCMTTNRGATGRAAAGGGCSRRG
ncbi:MAG TPA: hypothetical protein VMM92_10105 [Thermoanaerobaculia bacterium]|nr:hypothetical protein [Thermoanaerobaculia bacterium]